MADRSEAEQSKGPIERAKEWLQPGGSQTGPVEQDASTDGAGAAAAQTAEKNRATNAPSQSVGPQQGYSQ
ncbi:hypothetical protein WJX74_003208 [Apatococcus lobatus]|uniref:Uncharacterized protein n=2 Tax=Apatococcus TaxID=904362 RepID=A0AAW1SNM5_9CHLO